MFGKKQIKEENLTRTPNSSGVFVRANLMLSDRSFKEPFLKIQVNKYE